MILPADATSGMSIRDYLQLDDVTIEIGLTPNRGDCLSIQGIAREVAVINQLPLQAVEIKVDVASHQDQFAVVISAPEACPRYVGRIIKGVNPTAETPNWMQERLRRCDVRSISPIVDVTNYVMLELGQPMHAFDLSKLEGGINVRHALAGFPEGDSLARLKREGATHVTVNCRLFTKPGVCDKIIANLDSSPEVALVSAGTWEKMDVRLYALR